MNLPDEQVACFDMMYYTAANRPYEWWRSWSPAWNIVGKYARWAAPLRSRARSAVAKALGIDPRDLMRPSIGDADYDEGGRVDDHTTFEEWDERDRILHPFIVVHTRHGDFGDQCSDKVECFPTLDVLGDAVKHVQEELRRQKGIQVRDGDVIVTSDETKNEWWDQVRARGWKRIESGLGPEPEGKDLWSVAYKWCGFDQLTNNLLQVRDVDRAGGTRLGHWLCRHKRQYDESLGRKTNGALAEGHCG